MGVQIACVNCGTMCSQKTAKLRSYCSAACRAESWRNPALNTPCCYCGVPANSVDHIPPQSVRGFLIDSGLTHKYPFIQVMACLECNSLLGTKPIWDVANRRRAIKKLLAVRYKRTLLMPDWSDRELGSMSKSMASTIQMRIDIREWITERLAWTPK